MLNYLFSQVRGTFSMASLRRSLPLPPSIFRIAFSPAGGGRFRQMDPIRSSPREVEVRTIAERLSPLPICRQLTGDSHPLALPSGHEHESVETDRSRIGHHGSRDRLCDWWSTDLRWRKECTQFGEGAFCISAQPGVRQERWVSEDGSGGYQASGDK